MNFQAGRYVAKVVDIGLELITNKDETKSWPVLNVVFEPSKFRQGSIFVDGTFARVRKMYFLSEDLVKSGAFAGRSQIELVREQLKDSFGYQGGLSVSELQAIMGLEREIEVQNNQKGYPEVKYVNKPGEGPKRQAKALSPEILARLNASFLGQKPPEAGQAPNPSDFFSRLNNGG